MSGEPRETPDNPGVIAPPPLIYAGALVLGLVAKGRFAKRPYTKRPYLPATFLPRGLSRAFGWPLVICGLGIGLLGFRELRRAGTNPNPYEPATAIVTGGPYRFTRNPLYVGMTLMYAGIAARANALPAILLLPLVLHIMRRGVIEREEAYLERKFGDEYIQYKSRVRRWI